MMLQTRTWDLYRTFSLILKRFCLPNNLHTSADTFLLADTRHSRQDNSSNRARL